MPARVLIKTLLCIGAAIATSTGQEKDDLLKQELETLRGTWNYVTVEQDGVKLPRQKRGEPFQTITIRRNRYEVKRGDDAIHSGMIEIEPGKSPKPFSLRVGKGRGNGTVQLGIYEAEGDALRICLDPEGKRRPTKFESKGGTGIVLAVLQRERTAGVDPKDRSIVYDRIRQMNSGFKAYNGRAYDRVALCIEPNQKLVLPDKNTVVEKHDKAGLLLVYMEKRAFTGAHLVRPVSIARYRKTMGCAVKLEKGALLIGTFGESGFLEGSRSMRLLVLVPPKVEIERREGLVGGYGGRAGQTRPATAINPTRDDPKPPLTKSRKGEPPCWLPPTIEDGWHELQSVPDPERRVGKRE